MPKKIGNYELTAHLGQGGMAEVFKAFTIGSEGFRKPVALKRILPIFSDQKEFMRMLIDEAKMQANLNHPNLVHILGFEKFENTHAMIMEYVPGRNLKDVLTDLWSDSTQIPIAPAIFIICEVLKALEYIHQDHIYIIHRDISPQNILISETGQIKLTDFGVAWQNLKSEKTRSGVLKGKVTYLSPEQVSGQKLTHHSDLFSLGSLFYEMLCNTPTFSGESDYQIMQHIESTEYINSKELRPDIHMNIHLIISKMLSKQPEQRYKDSKELKRVLFEQLPKDWQSDGQQEFLKWLKLQYQGKTFKKEHPLRQTAVMKSQKNSSTKKMFTNKNIKTTWPLFFFIFLGFSVFVYTKRSFLLPQGPPKNTKESTVIKIPTQDQKTIQNEIPEPTLQTVKRTGPQKTASSKKSPTKPKHLTVKKGASKLSKLKVNVEKNTEVYINGKKFGATPMPEFNIKAGTYFIMLKPEKGQSRMRSVRISEGEQKEINW